MKQKGGLAILSKVAGRFYYYNLNFKLFGERPLYSLRFVVSAEYFIVLLISPEIRKDR